MPTVSPLIDDLGLGDRADPGDLFALLCSRRGWTPEYLRQIEDAGHPVLHGVPELVAALHHAHRDQQRVVIAPDFDMDGIAAGVLGYAGLAELGFNTGLHVPDYRRGHEFTPEDVDEISARWPDTRAVLTCDGAVNSHAGIAAARAQGWATWVTDHHHELPPGSSADITVDPNRLDETYPHPGICGANVLWQVLEAYARAHRPEKLWEIHVLRLFAGLGTVSDVMPLLWENRQLVRDSLSLARLLTVAAPRTIPNPWGGFDPDPDAIEVGQATLLRLLGTDPHHPAFVAAVEGFAVLVKALAQHVKVRDIDDVNEGLYGFYIAPIMNAPRRVGVPLDDYFALFTATDEGVKLAAAQRMIEHNEHRKELTARCLEELVSTEQPFAPWVYVSAAPPGMLGLLANRLMTQHGHPVVVLAAPADTLDPDEPVSGSSRSPEWFAMIEALEPHPGVSAIGHQQACGVKVARQGLLPELVAVLEAATCAAQADRDPATPRGDLVLGAGPGCDATLDDLEPLAELVRRVAGLRPFGHGFAEPRVELVLEPHGLRVDRIGSDAQHLRLVARSGLSCLWWNAAEGHGAALDELVAAAKAQGRGTALSDTTQGSALPNQRGQDGTVALVRCTASLQLNTFRGESRVQAVIDEWLAPV